MIHRSAGPRVLALVAVLMLAVGCGSASAASPVLEFESPLAAFPIPFTAKGGEVTAVLSNFQPVVQCSGSRGDGSITGPRSTLSSYVFTGCETEGGIQCQSEGALGKQIRTPLLEAELVFIDQARKEVGMVFDPHGGVYMEFGCGSGGENVKAFGPFLSPVWPLNQPTTSFEASLGSNGAIQIPSAYESLTGEQLRAIPTAETESHTQGTTGVQLNFAIQTSQPVTIKAITSAEIEAPQREEEERAAAKKRHDDEEAAKAAAAKRSEEEAASQRQQEATKARERARAQAKARARKRSKALKRCRRKADSKPKRVHCEHRAKKRFG